MSLLLLLIICNVLIAIIFKLFAKYQVDNLEAIISNYFTCYTLSCLIIGKLTISTSLIHNNWFPWALFLGVLFISVFNLTAISVQKAGMILTGIFHKMSLVFPALLGILFFSEYVSLANGIGIALALLSILLVNYKASETDSHIEKKYLILPLIIWLSSGVIESTFYYVNKVEIIKDANLEFTGILFFIAGLIGLPFGIFRRKANKLKNLIAGICLGIPNFFSIYLLLELLDKGWGASTVFPILNVAILAMTAIVGFFAFKEKLNLARIIGLFLAAASIYLVAHS